MAITAPPPATGPVPDSQGNVSIHFSAEAYAQVVEMASYKGKTVPETVRDALGMVRWIDKVLADGGRLIAEHPSGEREIITAR